MLDSGDKAEAQAGPDGASARYRPFAHLNTPNSGLYRAVMGVFVREKERYTVHLRPDDVARLLAPEARPSDPEDVVQAMDKLADWGNLRQDPDTGRVTAVEDFYRRRYIYQLTREGEAAEKALAAYDRGLGRRGELQAKALVDIIGQLRELLEMSSRSDPDPAVVHLAMRDLEGRFEELADNARAFMGSLQRTIDLHDAEVEAFLAYKESLIDYLQRFISDLVTMGAEIARLLLALEDSPTGGGRRIDGLMLLAAERDAADAAPGTEAEAQRRALALREHRWGGLRGWFLSSPEHEPQARLLRTAARSAVPQLLAVVSALNERRSGRSDRSSDFRALARWFAEAPDDDARHMLWRTAFGLYPARHLTVDPGTVDARDEEPVAPSTPWVQAPPIRISPRLRKTGSYERRGKPRRITDRSEERRHLAEQARRQAEQTAAARARLDTGGPMRLSDVGELDPEVFHLFLGLLGDALAAWPNGAEESVTTSGDGGMEIRLRAAPDPVTAQITTPDGVFSGPDHIVEITDLEGRAE
ncbi:TIGR02677 family protein [Nocardiopsis suaedae]|uniref:TIGR02677 family protein n=1 Tax=Nocardiopsis suaedae TaxID=3018444 RepID=A0ABT4TPN2_9ACTN|nr:TIGR02677 family protein [Nocardiopsis suaedae]MDA2806642.1 TIGR02677 family protein [Nocardiopsis suaedae]